MTPERRIELHKILRKLYAQTETTYWQFFRAGFASECHAFMEFCGLMGEFANMCKGAVEQGLDFAYMNVHGGVALPIKGHQVRYLYEKLECIYGPECLGALAELHLERQRDRS